MDLFAIFLQNIALGGIKKSPKWNLVGLPSSQQPLKNRVFLCGKQTISILKKNLNIKYLRANFSHNMSNFCTLGFKNLLT